MATMPSTTSFQSASSFRYPYTCYYELRNYKHIRMALLVYVHIPAHAGPVLRFTSPAPAVNGELAQETKSKKELRSNDLSNIYREDRLKNCASLLQTCTKTKEVKQLHAHMLRIGLNQYIFLVTKLVSMYTKTATMDNARLVFEKMCSRDVFLWNVMIRGYAKNGLCDEALMLFNQMQCTGIQPNSFTFPFVLTACAGLSALQEGKKIHSCVVKIGFESDLYVGNTLIDMYAKGGNIEDARHVFDKMSERDVITWNAMIAGYVQNGHANAALTIFHRMQLEGVNPDAVTILNVLPACVHLGALQQGKRIHEYVSKSAIGSNVFVQTALVDMYAKCGRIEIARQVFDEMYRKDLASWNAMIAGYGIHGCAEDALALFNQMQLRGMKPNNITFVGLLSACSHAGLVDKGKLYFDCMRRDFCITPSMEHYACMVDLLGRAGLLDEAYNFIKQMPINPSIGVWGALLGACRIHCNIELGERAAEHLFDLQPENAGYYVLLSNLYAAAGRWDDVVKVRTMMKEHGLKKTTGCSLIEINNRVHGFIVGDRSHPQSDKIYAMLETLARQMEEAGYVPNTNFVLHDVEEEMKEHILCSHSERLAISFGLINTKPGTPIQITKNLRVCADCHSASKFISKIVRREIIVRDANRFHHFKDGLCSCGDYW
eukprot:Gb_04460 [translate_table: standard]